MSISPEMYNNLMLSLDVMWKGMSAIFVVIFAIVLFVAVLNWTTNRKPKSNKKASIED